MSATCRRAFARPLTPTRRPQAAALVAGTLAVAAALALTAPGVRAQPEQPPPVAPVAPGAAAGGPAAEAAAPVSNSPLDAPLFYQLLIGELELRGGENGTAYAVILDAARRTRDEALFRRAVNIALSSRSGDQALAAARAWRATRPESTDALRTQLQILVALGRLQDLTEPARALINATPAPERGGTIVALPRFFARAGEPKVVAALVEEIVRPHMQAEGTRVPARVALGRAWLAAGDAERALALVREANGLEPAAPAPVLLAMEMMRGQPEAARIVAAHMARPDVEPQMRLAYVRSLTDSQRYAEAVAQLQQAVKQQPEFAPAYITLGALHLELRSPREAEAALTRYVELVQGARGAQGVPGAGNAPATALDDSDSDRDDEPMQASPERGLIQAWLMLAQAAEQRGDYAAAEGWLKRIDDPRRALEVQTRRASMLARQGKVGEAREMIRQAPERTTEDGRAKLVAEVGVLREVKRWREAYDVLAGALRRQPDDSDLLYEQAMMAEKLERLDEMERLLRRVIELKPTNAHAHNALGYSLADRRQRLPEARKLIQRALELAPGDPFITDSLGWVEFRMGNREEALRHLESAWRARPDTEIGAHLGEVLWAMGRKEDARRIWRESRGKDVANEVLRETLTRLRVDL
ncbi:MAG: tetratricopeptide repeat protein [Burkholderiales bacterium]|nr:tetratricopeptide repeat protein [Burkholderiales bacterium]